MFPDQMLETLIMMIKTTTTKYMHGVKYYFCYVLVCRAIKTVIESTIIK